jgi:polar amino acid transport system permease protein
MEALLENFFHLEVMKEALPYLWKGLLLTGKLSLVVVPLGLAGGLALGCLFGLSRPWLRFPLILWVDFFRAFPPLVLLVFVYYGLPFAGVEISSFAAVALAFFLNTSSYYGEIFRAGIESVPRGQWEAARSTGISFLGALVHVVLPQGARNVLPDLVSNTLEVVKLTSLASVVALPELLRMARVVQGITFNPTPLVLAALVYLALLWPMVRLLSRMEHRFRAAL